MQQARLRYLKQARMDQFVSTQTSRCFGHFARAASFAAATRRSYPRQPANHSPRSDKRPFYSSHHTDSIQYTDQQHSNPRAETACCMLRKLFTAPLRCLTSLFLAATMPPKKKRALAQDDEGETATVPAKKTKANVKDTKAPRTKKDAEGEFRTVPARLRWCHCNSRAGAWTSTIIVGGGSVHGLRRLDPAAAYHQLNGRPVRI